MVRGALLLLALVLLVMPALDLAWNEPKAAEQQGTRCPLHANPIVVVCPLALDAAQESRPGDVVETLLRPQLYDTSIFIPPSLPLPDSLQSPRGSPSLSGPLATNLDRGRHVEVPE
jgi:hypothetical protein